jgi:hypothetical protein
MTRETRPISSRKSSNGSSKSGALQNSIGKTHQAVGFCVPQVACYPCCPVAWLDEPAVASKQSVLFSTPYLAVGFLEFLWCRPLACPTQCRRGHLHHNMRMSNFQWFACARRARPWVPSSLAGKGPGERKSEPRSDSSFSSLRLAPLVL